MTAPGTKYVAGAAGGVHSILIRDDGVAVGFGGNGFGQRCAAAILAGARRWHWSPAKMLTWVEDENQLQPIRLVVRI